MSYTNNIPQNELGNYVQVNNWTVQYQSLLNGFYNIHPNGNISDVEFTIENKIFISPFHFTTAYDCSLRFKNCFFLEDVIFYNLKFEKSLILDHCFFDKEILIKESAEIGNFDLIMVSVKRQLYVEGGKFNDAKWTLIDNSIVKINGGTYNNLNIGYWGGGAILNHLSFHFPKVKGSIKITGSRAKIKRLELFEFAENISMSIEDISVNAVSIYRYRNEKALRFSNINTYEDDKESEFSIVESYLGKTEFYSVDFSKFKSVKILDCHVVDCVFINTRWHNKIEALKGRYIGKSKIEEEFPNKLNRLEKRQYENIYEKNILEADPEIISYYEKKREALRQLKYALGKQGDVINEQKFHALEMITYYKTLSWGKDWWTKFIIKFSAIFSDFGQSIGRPLAGLLFVHFVLFSMLLLTDVLTPLHFSTTNPTCDGFWLGIYQYFKLINPFRKADDTFQGGFIIIDLLMRIWASYMIYNIIRASRRFIK